MIKIGRVREFEIRTNSHHVNPLERCRSSPSQSIVATMPPDRSAGRNVFFSDLKRPSEQLGGLILNPGSVTHADFYSMMDIVLVISSPFFLQNEDGDTILRDSQPLLPGHYLIVADGTIEVNNEAVYTRAHSITTGSRVQSFTREVRDRDRRCVVSKIENRQAASGRWRGFEAAHIFPLAYEARWTANNYGRWITIDPPQGGGKINSVQNGVLLASHLHHMFDCYDFSINPDVSFSFYYYYKSILIPLSGRS